MENYNHVKAQSAVGEAPFLILVNFAFVKFL